MDIFMAFIVAMNDYTTEISWDKTEHFLPGGGDTTHHFLVKDHDVGDNPPHKLRQGPPQKEQINTSAFHMLITTYSYA